MAEYTLETCECTINRASSLRLASSWWHTWCVIKMLQQHLLGPRQTHQCNDERLAQRKQRQHKEAAAGGLQRGPQTEKKRARHREHARDRRNATTGRAVQKGRHDGPVPRRQNDGAEGHGELGAQNSVDLARRCFRRCNHWVPIVTET